MWLAINNFINSNYIFASYCTTQCCKENTSARFTHLTREAVFTGLNKAEWVKYTSQHRLPCNIIFYPIGLYRL